MKHMHWLTLLLALILCLTASALAEGAFDVDILAEECREASLTEGDPDYWREMYEVEAHNWRVVRNLPTAFETEGWKACEKAGPAVMNIDPENIDEKAQQKLLAFAEAYKGLMQVRNVADCRWFIWGDDMPTMEAEGELVFDRTSYDEPDFRPFLVPYMLEDQGAVKGNIIVVAGGGYSERANKGEGYPIAEHFNGLGYNCFVLQRRVAPYGKEDIWMDMQRSVRYLRYHSEELALGGMDCVIGMGFSGGSGTVLGAVQNLYGDVQPTIYDSDYIPDEIDAENSDMDAVCAMYGPNMDDQTEYKGMVTDNPNLPDMFIAAGQKDMYGAGDDCVVLAESLKAKTRMEFHYFADAPHGFTLGIGNNNSPYWPPMFDAFIDHMER